MTAGRTFQNLSLQWWWMSPNMSRNFGYLVFFRNNSLRSRPQKKNAQQLLHRNNTSLTWSFSFHDFLPLPQNRLHDDLQNPLNPRRGPFQNNNETIKYLPGQEDIQNLQPKQWKVETFKSCGRNRANRQKLGERFQVEMTQILLRESFTTKHWKSILPQELIL